MQVLDKGEMREYGEPYELMCNADSLLLQLVDKTGLVESERLKQIAVAPYLIPISEPL